MTGLLEQLARLLAAIVPALTGWLAGRRGAEASQARAAAKTLATQNEIAAKPNDPPDRLVARMRDGSL